MDRNMPSPDERVITLSVAKLNVVLAALGLASSIAGEIVAQAAEQERAAVLANGPDLEPEQRGDDAARQPE